MKKLVASVAAMPFLAGIALAGQPKPLTDTQMDKVTAGVATEVEWTSIVEVTVQWPRGPVTVEFGPDAPAAALITHPSDPLETGGAWTVNPPVLGWGST
jgi:hypothetical protein